MDLSELRSLDLKDIARASPQVKAVLLGVLFVLLLGAGYYVDWSQGMTQLSTLRSEEATLRDTYTQKKRLAYNYEAYKQRLAETEQALAALLRQLPNKAEMDALLTDINQVGVQRGLQFDLFRPGSETLADFYATMPVTIKVIGNYHDIAGFVSDMALLPRIVTVHDVVLSPTKEGALTMDATLRTYRYLDESEKAGAQQGGKP